jgi:hypothetical protein
LIRRALTWLVDRLTDSSWLRGMREHEMQPTQSAGRNERKAESLIEQVTIPLHDGGGW